MSSAQFQTNMADLQIGDAVKIDKRGLGRIVYRKKQNSEVKIVGIDHVATLSPRRLTKVPSTVTSNSTWQDHLYTEGSASMVQQSAFPEQIPSVQAETTQRFVRVTDSDVFNLISTEENHNTARKTFYDLKLLKQYLNRPEVLESREIYELPAPELNKILSKFFVSVRKVNGENYEPGSLRSMLSSFKRYLKRHGYTYSLISDLPFHSLRETVKSKQKELKREGKGNLPNKADPATDDEIDRLWQSGQFGSHSPTAMINSMWFFTTVHFGLRGDTEHRNMCWGDVSLCGDNEGREYLEFNERQTKTRTGVNPRDIRKIKPKMWDVPLNPPRCPVAIYKKYRSLRPIDYCKTGDPFYIATNTVHDVPNAGEQWFRRQPIGVNKIGSLMKTMAVKANLSSSKTLTNSSARKRLLQKISDENIPPTHIMQISGHRNIQSVNAYSSISENQHREISSILNSTSAKIPRLQEPELATSRPTSTQHAVLASQQVTSRVLSTSCSSDIAPIFAGPISGGVFNITINYNKEPLVPVRRRIRILESSSESSQEI